MTWACKVCGNEADADGMVTHVRGCYRVSVDDGGEEYIPEADREGQGIASQFSRGTGQLARNVATIVRAAKHPATVAAGLLLGFIDAIATSSGREQQEIIQRASVCRRVIEEVLTGEAT